MTRLDLQPYVDGYVEAGEGVRLRLATYAGDDTWVAQVGRAVVGQRAKKWRTNDRALLRWMLRNGVEQPFRLTTATWEVIVPETIRHEFATLGSWTYNTLEGDPLAQFQGRGEAYGIWAVDLWSMLAAMERWGALHQPRELRLAARHIAIVVRKWCPLVYDAWADYVDQGVRLSAIELQVLRDMIENEIVAHKGSKGDFNVERWVRSLLAKRNLYEEEQDEFVAKMDVARWGRRRPE